MAQEVKYFLIDDMDGSRADETVRYGLDGQAYEIDLSAEHAQELRDALSPWIAKSRRQPRRVAGKGRGAMADSATIRQWARARGMEVSDRGRISADIREAYLDAH